MLLQVISSLFLSSGNKKAACGQQQKQPDPPQGLDVINSLVGGGGEEML